MHKLDSFNLTQKILSCFGKVTSTIVVKPYEFDHSSKNQNGDSGIEPQTEHYCSGGFNEAFIFEHWASFGPRH